MKKKELQTLREKTENSIEGILEKKRKELLGSYLKIKSGKEKNVKKIKNIRRDISQIMTVLKEKELFGSGDKKDKMVAKDKKEINK